MSRNLYAIAGWVLIVVAVVSGLLTVPVWNGRGSVADGSLTVDSNPLATTVVGNGQFTYEAFWSVSWTAAVVCGLVLACGLFLVRRRPRQIASPAIQEV